MINQEHIDRIDQRRRYLEKRIEAKRMVGWETVYDESEHAALAWALEQLRAPAAAANTVTLGPGLELVAGGGRELVDALDRAVSGHREHRTQSFKV